MDTRLVPGMHRAEVGSTRRIENDCARISHEEGIPIDREACRDAVRSAGWLYPISPLMNPQIGKRKWLFLMAGGAACLITPLLLLWLTAPADPVHNGVRLSTRLYRAYGKGFPRNYQTIVDE